MIAGRVKVRTLAFATTKDLENYIAAITLYGKTKVNAEQHLNSLNLERKVQE